MGAITLSPLDLYWTSKWPFLFPTFSPIMSPNKFEQTLKLIDFNNSKHQIAYDQPAGHDHLFKIRPFLSSFIKSFQQAYIPHQNLSVDENMIGFIQKPIIILLVHSNKALEMGNERKHGFHRIPEQDTFGTGNLMLLKIQPLINSLA